MKNLEKLIINTGALVLLTPWLVKNSPMIINSYLKKKRK